jgi:hypothetical protein
MSDFDFSSLSAEVTELPKREGGRTRKIQNNPFLPWVQESYSTGTGRAVEVPNEHVKRTEYLIRQAAEDLGIGVRVVMSLDKEARDKAPKNKKVRVSFQGQEKRKYEPRKRKNSSADTVPETTE